MIFNRHWFALIVTCCCARVAVAQYGIPGGTPSSSSSSAPASSSGRDRVIAGRAFSARGRAHTGAAKTRSARHPRPLSPRARPAAATDVTGASTGGLGRFRAPEQAAPAYTLPGIFWTGKPVFRRRRGTAGAAEIRSDGLHFDGLRRQHLSDAERWGGTAFPQYGADRSGQSRRASRSLKNVRFFSVAE